MTLSTKNHISKTIVQEFSKNKYTSFTIQDLSKIANLARSTVYYQFSSLSDVYRYILEENIMKKVFNDSKSWQNVVDFIVDYITENPNLCTNLYNQTLEAKRYEYCQKQIYNVICKYNGYYTMFYSFEELEIYNQELEYMVDGFIFTLEHWFKNNLDDDPNNVKKRMCGYLEVVMKIIKKDS